MSGAAVVVDKTLSSVESLLRIYSTGLVACLLTHAGTMFSTLRGLTARSSLRHWDLCASEEIRLDLPYAL